MKQKNKTPRIVECPECGHAFATRKGEDEAIQCSGCKKLFAA